MDWLVWLLFESFPALGALLFVVLFVLLVHWRRTGRSRSLLIGLAIARVLLVTQKLVVTQREHARLILANIERDLIAAKADALETALSPEFAAEGLDRQQFLDLVHNRLHRLAIKDLSLWSLNTTESAADRFSVTAVYHSEVNIDGMRGDLPSTWQITFVRGPDGWKISGVRCVALPGVAHPTLSVIGGM